MKLKIGYHFCFCWHCDPGVILVSAEITAECKCPAKQKTNDLLKLNRPALTSNVTETN